MACFNKSILGSGDQVDSVKNRPESDSHLEKELWKAKQEWDNARNFFNQVADPDLVDLAIFEMKAAERRYMHLLKIIKKEQGQFREDPEEVVSQERGGDES